MIPHSVKRAVDAVSVQSRIELKERNGAGPSVTKFGLCDNQQTGFNPNMYLAASVHQVIDKLLIP